jgi:ParB/RepB/Spo0J family partition protein
MHPTGQQCLPVAAIHPSPLNPRREISEAGLVDLAASMAASGLLQPIVVYPDGEDAWRVIAGERRLRAAQFLRWEQIPAIVRQEPTEEEARTLSLVENLQRTDLNPIEAAEAMLALYEGGMPQGRIAHQIGRTQGFVSNRLRLLRLPEPVQGLLRQGLLTVEWGETLLAWEDEPELCGQLAAVAANHQTHMKVADLQARARAEGRIGTRQKPATGSKGGEAAPLPAPLPRPGAAAWAEEQIRGAREIREDRSRREAFAALLFVRLVSALLAVPASRDCRRGALLAYEALVRLPVKTLAQFLAGQELQHLVPLINPFSGEGEERAWEALAALDAETLFSLAAEALLARDLEQWEELGEEPRRARWYAGLGEEES